MNYKKELEAAKEAAILAGKMIMDIYESSEDLSIEYKDGDMPLTRADKSANAIIIKILKERFPDYAILSEEEKDNKERLNNPYCFVIDPLDGTKEFIKRNGQFTVNIALSYEHESVMGVIYVPTTEVIYFASKGAGAFLKDKVGIRRIKVSDVIDKKELRVVMSNSHGCEKMNQLLEKYHLTHFVKVGSSLKGCMVAEGSADIYYRYNPTMEWDTAAMQCIVEEAGGIFRQMDGSVMYYNRNHCLNEKGFYLVNCSANIIQ
ncbi:MAG: 3'(2'),5'-bisphosphate nucleotidase CysQ [Lachnospiraceae bacterium]|nr:3'(2'),5'-bisphosphate nucleotidase CysQ [Lachnospiraceae bacterium]